MYDQNLSKTFAYRLKRGSTANWDDICRENLRKRAILYMYVVDPKAIGYFSRSKVNNPVYNAAVLIHFNLTHHVATGLTDRCIFRAETSSQLDDKSTLTSADFPGCKRPFQRFQRDEIHNGS